MGCDIHFVVERRVIRKDGTQSNWIGWVAEKCWVHYTNDNPPKRSWRYARASQRNYSFFGKLANVRGDGTEPLGMPDDASELALTESEYWGEDGHSHSYCSAQEFIEKCAASQHEAAEIFLKSGHPAVKDPYGYFLDMEPPNEDEEYRVVFWFDN